MDVALRRRPAASEPADDDDVVGVRAGRDQRGRVLGARAQHRRASREQARARVEELGARELVVPRGLAAGDQHPSVVEQRGRVIPARGAQGTGRRRKAAVRRVVDFSRVQRQARIRVHAADDEDPAVGERRRRVVLTQGVHRVRRGGEAVR